MCLLVWKKILPQRLHYGIFIPCHQGCTLHSDLWGQLCTTRTASGGYQGHVLFQKDCIDCKPYDCHESDHTLYKADEQANLLHIEYGSFSSRTYMANKQVNILLVLIIVSTISNRNK